MKLFAVLCGLLLVGTVEAASSADVYYSGPLEVTHEGSVSTSVVVGTREFFEGRSGYFEERQIVVSPDGRVDLKLFIVELSKNSNRGTVTRYDWEKRNVVAQGDIELDSKRSKFSYALASGVVTGADVYSPEPNLFSYSTGKLVQSDGKETTFKATFHSISAVEYSVLSRVLKASKQ